MSCPEHGRMLNPNVGFVGIWNPETLLQGPASMQPPLPLERPDYRPLFPNAGDFDFPPLGPLSPAWSQTTLHPILPSDLHPPPITAGLPTAGSSKTSSEDSVEPAPASKGEAGDMGDAPEKPAEASVEQAAASKSEAGDMGDTLKALPAGAPAMGSPPKGASVGISGQRVGITWFEHD